MAIFEEITENDCINERHPFVKGDNLLKLRGYWCEIGYKSV